MRTNEAVWQAKYKRWRIMVQVDGVRRSFYSGKAGTRGKAEAERKADAWIRNGTQERQMTFDELAASYLSHIRTANGTAHKQRESQIISLYLPWHTQKVSSLTNLDYQEVIDACVEKRDKPLSARTCGHIRTTIKALYHHARKAGVKMTEPYGLTIPTGATKRQRMVLQPEHIKRIFAEEGHYIYIFQFLLLTGLRPGEVCGLQKTDLHGDVLTIRRARNILGEITAGKNDNARRTIKLTERALATIQPNDTDWLFVNTLGSPLAEKTLYKAWLRIRKALELPPVTLYELRHTMISYCKSVVPLPLLKQAVGHSESMDTYSVYAHEIDGDLQATADLIQAAFEGVMR